MCHQPSSVLARSRLRASSLSSQGILLRPNSLRNDCRRRGLGFHHLNPGATPGAAGFHHHWQAQAPRLAQIPFFPDLNCFGNPDALFRSEHQQMVAAGDDGETRRVAEGMLDAPGDLAVSRLSGLSVEPMQMLHAPVAGGNDQVRIEIPDRIAQRADGVCGAILIALPDGLHCGRGMLLPRADHCGFAAHLSKSKCKTRAHRAAPGVC